MTFSNTADFIYPHETCSYIEGGVKLPSGFFKRNIIMPVDQVNAFREKYQNTDIYTTVYQYDDPVNYRTGNKYGALYIDFDRSVNNEDYRAEYEKVRHDAITATHYFKTMFGIPYTSCNFYFSGYKGLHITIHPRVFGLQPNPYMNRIFKSIVKKIPNEHNTIDTGIYDVVRLWRVPNSINNKSRLYKIPLTFEEMKTLPFEQVMELARQPRLFFYPARTTVSRARLVMDTMIKDFLSKIDQKTSTSKATGKPMEYTPPCVTTSLSTPTQMGQRNNTGIALASVFWQQGYSEDECYNELSNWSNSQCSPPLEEEELRSIVRSQYSHEYKFGCSKFEELGLCNKDGCRFGKKRVRVR